MVFSGIRFWLEGIYGKYLRVSELIAGAGGGRTRQRTVLELGTFSFLFFPRI